MNNAKISINLRKLPGAQILKVTMPDGKVMSGVFIPAAYNDMIREKDGVTAVSPYLNVMAWEAHQNYIAKCVENHRGEDNYTPPTHTLELSLSKDFRERALASARKRILASNPGIVAEELEKQVKAAVRIGIGDMTEIKRDTQPSYQVQGSAVAAAVTDSDPIGEATPDDLPF